MDNHSEQNIKPESSPKHHLTFDEDLVKQVITQAEKLEYKAKKSLNTFERKRLIKKADSYHEAIGIMEGMTKAEAVDWIQNAVGGKKSAKMADAGEYESEVWSRQTACDVLSSWQEIFKTIASVISSNSPQESQ
jgi:hypothetical protein